MMATGSLYRFDFKITCEDEECEKPITIEVHVIDWGQKEESMTRDYPGAPAEGPELEIVDVVRCGTCGQVQNEQRIFDQYLDDMIEKLRYR
jgi:hypothetical protein